VTNRPSPDDIAATSVSVMSVISELNAYLSDYGPTTLARNLVRRGTQHAKYQVGKARGRRPSFAYQGDTLEYFWHPYNRTWLSERALEIPIAQRFLARYPSDSLGLEIGNVLAHYQPITHRVVDKYETSPGVENIDVVDVTAPEPLDFVLAISTLEHVGWDEPIRDLTKAPAALDHLRSLLDPHHGRLLLTAPLGHNPGLDAYLLQSDHGALTSDIFVRDHRDRWTHVDRVEPHQVRYLYELRSAGCLWAGEFAAK